MMCEMFVYSRRWMSPPRRCGMSGTPSWRSTVSRPSAGRASSRRCPGSGSWRTRPSTMSLGRLALYLSTPHSLFLFLANISPLLPRTRITISCRMNFDDYPLDAHTCQFQVGSCKFLGDYPEFLEQWCTFWPGLISRGDHLTRSLEGFHPKANLHEEKN